MTPQEALRLGLRHHQGGDLDQAEAIYRQLLRQSPRYGDAWHLLGVVRLQKGDAQDAAQLIETALRHQPDTADYYANLAEARRQAGRFDTAAQAAERALRLAPQHSAARNALALAKLDGGDVAGAVATLQELLRRQPTHLQGWSNLVGALNRLGRADEAEAAATQALAHHPGNPTLAQQLGDLLVERGRPEAAFAAYGQGAGQGWSPPLLKSAALALWRLGKAADAEHLYRTLLQHWPEDADGWNRYLVFLLHGERFDEAEAALSRVLAIQPDHADALGNAALLTIRQRRFRDADAVLARLFAIAPEHVDGLNHLARLRLSQGRVEEAVAAWQKALSLDPQRDQIHSNLLFGRHYRLGPSSRELGLAHRAWAERHGETAERPPEAARPAGQPRLRVGYLSPDLRRHPVGFLLAGILPWQDRERFHLHAYADLTQADPLTVELHGHVDGWTTIAGWNDRQVAERIRADGIDILIDLAGHTAGQRLGVLALRPAPMQASWLGYVDTTGLASVDYLLTDRHSSPPDLDQGRSETALYLPDCRFCYAAPDYAPAPGRSERDEAIVFGCFNNYAKLDPAVFALWAELLRRLPDARLLLKTGELDDADTAADCRRRWLEAGGDPARLELRGYDLHAEALAQYGDVDIALDPFPFTGGISTLEALWMGVPVVTLAGDGMASRQGAALLATAGLDGWIAADAEAYLAIAQAVAGDAEARRSWRERSRAVLSASPLCDGRRFAAGLDAALAEGWRRLGFDLPDAFRSNFPVV